MNYEKAYKDALERAREIHNEHRAQCFDVMVKVFPELKESEDERIRKALIELVKYNGGCLQLLDKPFNDVPIDTMLAWLEKQGEQKEIDYNEELEKCKANPLYFFDKYVKVKFKE